MKEDILSVSELPMHTTNSEIFKVLNVLIAERGLKLKNCVGVEVAALPVLQVNIQVWSLKLRIWRGGKTCCQRTLTFMGKTWPPREVA
jgi:hypothetical protein